MKEIMCCKNCRYFVTYKESGRCTIKKATIRKDHLEKYKDCCVVGDCQYISCPHCNATVVMDWHCHRCGKDIYYDIDKYGVRSNPHK